MGGNPVGRCSRHTAYVQIIDSLTVGHFMGPRVQEGDEELGDILLSMYLSVVG